MLLFRDGCLICTSKNERGFAGETPSAFISSTFWCLVSAVGQTWSRMVKPYLLFPWSLALLVNDDVSLQNKSEVAEAFVKTDECCLDEGFSKPLHQLITCADEIMPGGEHWHLLKAAFQGSICNIACENAFARLKSMSKTSRGRRDLTHNICCKHILAEAKSAHLGSVVACKKHSFQQAQPESSWAASFLVVCFPFVSICCWRSICEYLSATK